MHSTTKRCGTVGIACLSWLLAGAAALAQEPDSPTGLRLPPPTFPGAAAELRAGRPAEALASLERNARTAGTAPPALEQTILRATLLAATGLGAEAESAWRSVIERAVFMRTFARRAIVESAAGRGAPADAEPFLAELTRGDPARHRDLVLHVAEAYLRTGTPDRAAALYREVLAATSAGADADAARLGLADALEAAGDGARALATLREAQLRHRTADAFVAGRREARRLARARGETLSPFTETEYRGLVRRLRSASRFEPALALLDEWAAAFPGRESRERIAAERVETLYAQRDNEAAVAACAAFRDRFPSSPLGPAVRLTEFRLAVRMGDMDRARRLGADLWEGRVPGATSAQRRGAAVLLAAALVATGDVDGGLALFPGLFETAPTPDDQRAILWRAGVAAVRTGHYQRALTNLRSLIEREPDGNLALAAQYWLGVAHEQRGDHAAAAGAFEPLAMRYPYHYYGLTARRRLTEIRGRTDAGLEALPPLDFPSLALEPASRGRAEFRAAMALARAGLIDDAAWYLRRLLSRSRGDRALALLTARASAQAGDHASAARVLFNHFTAYFNQPARGLPDDFLSMAYPRPFWDTVVDSARAHDADPMLLVSLMRSESRFDPAARSAVGAVGLLQIMPYTAEALAERAGVGDILAGGVDDATLAEPRVNIAIAARLNADLLALFDGARLPVIASYNAGEDRAGEWWAAARDLRDDFFVDGIPYTETRNFTRGVLANYAAYERIYGAR
ncbi:MAG: transglycosylase SLT domain-containing protein [Acidobacteria bacterium]|nr:transglycosylase SLT domain-containing protein [Acidobacteriota bacterium]